LFPAPARGADSIIDVRFVWHTHIIIHLPENS
jgi:hypothetical protein